MNGHVNNESNNANGVYQQITMHNHSRK